MKKGVLNADSSAINVDLIDISGVLNVLKNTCSKVIKIIEMSKEGRTLEEIKNAVRMSNGNINSARRWGRQAGLW